MTEAEQPPPVPGLVWYAGYGSNLCAERFRCYLAGGVPPGLEDPCRGARDGTNPLGDRPIDLAHRLYFAGNAKTWGGAPCFVDAVPTAGRPTYGRAYLITWEQFEDVVAQENGRRTTPIDLDSGALAEGQSVRLGPGRYEHLLCLGTLEGVPVVTITSPWGMADAPIGAPSPAYLKVIIAGLRESRAMDDDAIVDYLGSAPGCAAALVAAALAPADGSED